MILVTVYLLVNSMCRIHAWAVRHDCYLVMFAFSNSPELQVLVSECRVDLSLVPVSLLVKSMCRIHAWAVRHDCYLVMFVFFQFSETAS